MAAQPNARYATPPKNNIQNGSSQDKEPYSLSGYCSRCARVCIKCQQGTPLHSGYPTPKPAPSPAAVQHRPIPRYCAGRLSACTNSGHAHNSFRGSTSVNVETPTAFVQPSQRASQYEQLAVQTMFPGPIRSADTAFKELEKPPLRPMSMRDYITEEATVDELTKKTSVLQLQRSSTHSTGQKASRVSRLSVEGASEWGSPEDVRIETMRTRSPLQLGNSMALRSTATQADISHDERSQHSLAMALQTEDRSEITTGIQEQRDDDHRELFLNECTSLERPPSGLGWVSEKNSVRCQAEQVSCERVTDCIKKSFEKLEEIHSTTDRHGLSSRYFPQRRHTSPSAPIVVRDTLSRDWAGQNVCLCIKRSPFKAQEYQPQPEATCRCSRENEKLQSDRLLEYTDPVKKASLLRSSHDKSESIASIPVQLQDISIPTDLSGKKSAITEQFSQTEFQPSGAFGLSDSNVTKGPLTRENSGLPSLDMKDRSDSVLQHKQEASATQGSAPPHTLSMHSSAINSSQLSGASKRQDHSELPTTEKMTPSQKESFLKEPSLQQELESKTSTLQKSATSIKTSLQQESHSKTSATSKQLPDEMSELRAKSVSRTKVSEKLPDLLFQNSTQLQETSRPPTAQSSKQYEPVSPKPKLSQTQATQLFSEASITQLSLDRKQWPEPTSQKSSASVPLPRERKSYAAANAPSTNTVALSPTQRSTSKIKEKTPPKTPDQEETAERGRSPRTDNVKSPVKTLDKDKITPETPDQETRLSKHGNLSSSHIKQSSVSDQKLPLFEKSDQTETENELYCVHAYYLPLYQCAYCQQVTTHPVSCQMGIVARCPSPYDPRQCHLCYPSSLVSCLPCPYQDYPLACPQLCPLEYAPDQNSQTHLLDKRLCSEPTRSRTHSIQQRPSKPAEVCQKTCSEPVAPCRLNDKDACPQSCENNACCPTSASCLTRNESSISLALCQECGLSCEKNNSGDGSENNNDRDSIELDQSDLQSLVSKLTISVSSREPKKEYEKGINEKSINSRERNTGDKASSRNSKSSTSKVEGLRKENGAKEMSRLDGDKTKKLDKQPNKEYDERRRSGKDQGRIALPTREQAYRKKFSEQYGDLKTVVDMRKKFRREKACDKSEEITMKGSGTTKSRRSPHRPASAQSGSSLTFDKLGTLKQGKLRNLRSLGGEGQTGWRADMRMTPAIERGGLQKAGRSVVQSLFDTGRAIAGPVGLHRSTNQALQSRSSQPFRSSLSKTMLRKFKYIQPKADSSPRMSKKESTPQIGSRVLREPPSPEAVEHVSEAKREGPRLSSSIFQNETALCSQPRSYFNKLNDETSQKSNPETNDDKMATPYSHIPSSFDSCAGNEQLHSSTQRHLYPDREKRKKLIHSSYYLSPIGARAPHRAIALIKRHKIAKRLEKRNDESQVSKCSQRKECRVPSSSSSSSSDGQDSASYQSQDGNCGSWQRCSWINGAPFPEYCCAHAWANAPHYICPLHSHLAPLCPGANFQTSSRRRPTKIKPPSLRSQRTRRLALRGKLHLGQQNKPR